MPTAKITRTSPDSAGVEPIVLRPGKTTRLVLKPQLVNNQRDKTKPVKGELLWQRRKASEQDEEWADEASLSLTTMKAGSGIKLNLDTEELYLLTQAIRGLYGVYWKNGKRLPESGEVFDLEDYAEAAKTLDTLEEVTKAVNTAGAEGLINLLRCIATQENSKRIIESMQRLDLDSLAEINSLAGIGMLKRVLTVWNNNQSNGVESFWQDTLAQYSFVFSQVFSTPVVVFGTKTYIGGKDIESSGGKEPDFLLKNELTNHALIVEIKTLTTDLLGKSPYRPPDVFSVSRDLSGALVQISRYKDKFLQNYSALRLDSEREFRLVDPQCLVVVGNSSELGTAAKKDSFEHFRRALRGVEIVTFDELFKKVEVLATLLEGSAP